MTMNNHNQLLLQEFLRLCEPLGIEYINNTGEMAFKYRLPTKYSPFNIPLKVNLFLDSIDIWIEPGEESKALESLYENKWARLGDYSIEEVLCEMDSDIYNATH